MRRRAAAVTTVVLLGLAAGPVLSACSSSSSGGGSSASPSVSVSLSPVADTGPFPTVSGKYGEKPTLTFPSAKPAAALQRTLLSTGKGAQVRTGDLLVADYLGQVWNGKVFDNSFDRKEPSAFPIGVGKVIKGWDEALVGVPVGSRVLLSIPPDQGYGKDGNGQAGIKGTDTLVFVVDITGTYAKTAAGQSDAKTADAPPAGVTVTGDLGKPATVAVKSPPAVTPTKQTVTVLAKGSGPAVAKGTYVTQYSATDWSGKVLGSTWDSQAEAVPVGSGSASASPFDLLVGIPVGSRVLLLIPANAAQQQPAVAVVLDVVAKAETSAQVAAG